jgi:hypothetical protein
LLVQLRGAFFHFWFRLLIFKENYIGVFLFVKNTIMYWSKAKLVLIDRKEIHRVSEENTEVIVIGERLGHLVEVEVEVVDVVDALVDDEIVWDTNTGIVARDSILSLTL